MTADKKLFRVTIETVTLVAAESSQDAETLAHKLLQRGDLDWDLDNAEVVARPVHNRWGIPDDWTLDTPPWGADGDKNTADYLGEIEKG